MRHFDAHAYRTEDAEGVWDFARGCMRTYLILARQGRSASTTTPRSRPRSPTRRSTELAEPTRPSTAPTRSPRSAPGPHDVDALARPGLRPRAARPARHRAAARRPLADRRAAGPRGRLVDAVHQGRGPRRRHRRRSSRRGRAPHPPTTPPRSEQDPARGGRRSSAARAPAARPRRRRGRGRRPAARHGRARRRRRGAAAGQAVERHRVGARRAAGCSTQLADGAAAWADGVRHACPVAAFTITKLSWLHRSEPEAWARVARVLPAARLADVAARPARLVTDRGDASGTGYWSPAEERVPARPARASSTATATGRRRSPTCSARSSRPATWRDAVVGPGTGDNMAAALGLGLRPGDVAISLGTSGTVFAVSDTPTADATGAVAGFADATGRFLPLVCTLNATKVTDAVARLLGVDHAELDDARARRARRAPAGSCSCPTSTASARRTGPTPPARSPASAPTSRREQLARAAVEGVVCGLLDGLDALADASVRWPTAGCCSSAAAPGAPPTAGAGRPHRPAGPRARRRRARRPRRRVQASAVLTRRPSTTSPPPGASDRPVTVDPDLSVDRAAIRAAYTDALLAMETNWLRCSPPIGPLMAA